MIFYEYAIDVAAACHARGVKTVAVTAGYMCAGPRAEFFRCDRRRQRRPQSVLRRLLPSPLRRRLEPVLDTLKYLRRETDVWLEITTLLIPGENDSAEEIDALTRWVGERLGAKTRCTSRRSTPTIVARPSADAEGDAVSRARPGAGPRPQARLHRQRARPEGETTICADCGAPLIGRDGSG